MKPAIRFTLPLACLAALTTMVGGDPEPQPQINFTQAGLGTFKADWQGVAGRTYFTQFSLDHVTWRYAPFIDFGGDPHNRGLDSTSNTFFVRLRWGDISAYTSLDQAMNGHLDGDGLSNIFEVTYGYDPFENTSTTDGPDGEVDPDDDGLGNASEQAGGSNPMAMDNPIVQLEVTVE